MSGFSVWFQKELMEIWRTWRVWVIPGMLLFFAISSPILAEITPDLVRSMATDEPGVVIELPDPVALDAIRQWAQSLSQIMLIAVIIASAGLVANERRSGTVALILTKPLSWSSFVVAKVAAQLLLIGVAAAIAAFVCALFTMGIFGDVPLEGLVGVTALWIVTAFLFVGIMVLVQVIVPSTASAAGIGIAIYAIFSLAGIWQPVRDYTPAGLFGAMNDIAAAGDASVLWPVLFAIPLALACIVAGIWLFQRQPQTGRVGDM